MDEKELEHLLALASAATPYGALLVDDGGRIVFANAAVTRILGWTEKELIGQPVEMLIPERARSAHRAQRETYQREPRAREMAAGRELFARCKRGGEIPVEVALNPLGSGRPGYTLATLVDLSARREMAERMEASERLATLGTLAASVAHEVNNPNAFIAANLESLRRHLSAISTCLEDHGEVARVCAPELREAMAAIEDSLEGVRRVTAIVGQLRVLTRTPGAEDPRTEIRLNDVVRWASLLVQGRVLERAQLILELADDLPPMLGYSGQLSQVVTNLLTNALQAIPPGRPDQHRITITTTHRAGRLRLTVEDTGVGMDAETRAQAFRRFFTTKPIGVGSGLGLPISREIVEGHGGELSLEPRPAGTGTRARVELPAHLGPIPRFHAEAATIPPAEHQARILVVDDDPAIRRAYKRVLHPHDVVGTDGPGAWRCFSNGDTDFDMVLCDVTMPVLDGPSLLERVRERWPELSARFVFSTGGAVSPRARSLIEEGTHPVLYKPVRRDTLLAALRDRLAGASGRPPDKTARGRGGP